MAESKKTPACNARMGAMPGDPRQGKDLNGKIVHRVAAALPRPSAAGDSEGRSSITDACRSLLP
jgi:hypothetical protein